MKTNYIYIRSNDLHILFFPQKTEKHLWQYIKVIAEMLTNQVFNKFWSVHLDGFHCSEDIHFSLRLELLPRDAYRAIYTAPTYTISEIERISWGHCMYTKNVKLFFRKLLLYIRYVKLSSHEQRIF